MEVLIEGQLCWVKEERLHRNGLEVNLGVCQEVEPPEVGGQVAEQVVGEVEKDRLQVD